MVENRKEPTLSGGPLSSSSEPKSRGPSKATKTPPPTRPAPVVKPHTSTTSSTPVIGIMALLLALLAGGGGGYLYLQLQDTSSALSDATQRIADLEGRLALSDDESAQSLTAVQAVVKENSSEIRKLWGVSYDTNRKRIAANKDTANKAASDVSGLKKSVSALQKQAKQIESVSQQLQLQGTQLSEMLVTLEGLSTASASVDGLKTQISGLEKSLSQRVAGNEEAIRSIDAFRRSTNRQLLELKQLAGGGTAP